MTTFAWIKQQFPSFQINGREGRRVGYWCVKCNKPIPLNSVEIREENGSVFSNVYHLVCGLSVSSIWDDDGYDAQMDRMTGGNK
jgi:hypothetical protein